ncbi:unnamed protein product, partial [Mesorhabditis belari]|uniref:Intraflagellar transport protein 74 homolog n=1 Tax=Mesorhabditis belari TaxID=2138241 RepID=A0AAF3ENG3_9BILA
MSRPPSARPKTSAGRAPSARQRPQTAARPPTSGGNGGILIGGGQRPESRSSVSRGPASEPRLASRSGLPAPRVPTAARNDVGPTDRPMSGAMIRPMSSAARPITQQGLVGARTASRMGTASQRQVFDKSYYIGVLKSRISALNQEIGKLQSVAAKGEKDRNELGIYEKQAEESAIGIKELQGRLADLNMVVERMHTSSELGDIDLEAREVRGKADQIALSVEELFAERRNRETHIERLFAEIDEQKKLNQAVIASMEANIREKYEDRQRAAAALRDQLEGKENELKDMDRQRISLEQELHASPLKQKAIELRERLLEEELREFDNEIDVLTGEQNERYIELKRKEQQMSEFLSTFDEQKRLSLMELEELSEAVVQNLKRIATNLAKVNIGSQVTGMDPSGDRGEFASASTNELKEVHVRLQEEMISLGEMEEVLRNEIETLKTRIDETNEQTRQFSDSAQLEKDVELNSRKLSERHARLERSVPEIEGHQTQMESQFEELMQRLERSEAYRVLTNAQKRLEVIARETAETRNSFERSERETNFIPVKERTLHLQKEYNEILAALTLGQKIPYYQNV